MPRSRYIKPAKFADLSAKPIGAAFHVRLPRQDCPFSFEIPMEQAHALEADGFTIHWLMPKAEKTAEVQGSVS